MILKTGIDPALECYADDILWADRVAARRVLGHSMVMYGILSEDQEELRRKREVASLPNHIDLNARPGLYTRAYNPLAGTRPTTARRFSVSQDPWRQDIYEHLDYVGGFVIPNWSREEITSGEHAPRPGVDRDRWWPTLTGAARHADLDRYQRCRIRARMRRAVDKPAVRYVIAAQYGVDPTVIVRIERGQSGR